MTWHFNEKLLLQRHAAMLKYQKEIAPFTPTINELVGVWGMRSSSHAYQVLQRLEERGMVVTRYKNAKRYYAVKDTNDKRTDTSNYKVLKRSA